MCESGERSTIIVSASAKVPPCEMPSTTAQVHMPPGASSGANSMASMAATVIADSTTASARWLRSFTASAGTTRQVTTCVMTDSDTT
ncbi:hypothetical protein D9M72_376160 [compost metagenome]